jgi:serine/threonine protein kinase
MDIVSLSLSAASAAQQLFDCGLRIYRRVKHEKKINSMIREIQIFEIEDKKAQLVLHIELAQAILRNSGVEQEHKDRLERNWKRITSRLAEMDRLVQQMVVNSSIWETKARHEARDQLIALENNKDGNKPLSEILRDFQDVVMVMRVLMNDETPLYLSGNDFSLLDIDHHIPVSGSGTFLGKGRLTSPSPDLPSGVQWYLVESKPYLNTHKEDARENIRTLARKIHRAQPNRGILKLVGFRDEFNGQQGAFQLIFTAPFAGEPCSTLSQYLLDHPRKPSLNYRISLCYQLAMAVLQTQTLGLVHKNIRPENMLLSRGTNSYADTICAEPTPVVYLSGWQYARQVDHGVTNLRNETTLQKKIYQHPERQLPLADKEYSMAHDVYSLGVCMLEILNWESLLEAENNSSVSEAFKEAYRALENGTDSLEQDRYTKFPDCIKRTLVYLNDTRTSVAAGTKICRLVRRFLTCLDEKDDDNGDLEGPVVLEDKDRRRIAMHFVDTALKDIRTIQCAI